MKFKILFVAFLFLSSIDLSAQNQKKVDSLASLLKTANDKEKVLIYESLFRETRGRKMDAAKAYLDSMEVISERTKSNLSRGIYYRAKGVSEGYGKDYKASEKSFRRSISYLEKTDDTLELSHSFNNLGINQRMQGRLDSAMVYHMKSIKIREKFDADPNILGQNYLSIGTVHALFFKYEKAKEYFQKAENIYLQNGNQRMLASAWNRIAVLENKQGNSLQAISFYKKADSLYKLMKYTRGRSLLVSNLGNAYASLDSIQLSNNYFKEAIELARKTGQKQSELLAMSSLGYNAHKVNQYQKALNYYYPALEMAEQGGMYKNQSQLYRKIAETYAAMGEHKKAYDFRGRYMVAYDSIFNKDVRSQIDELEKKYETEKKEAALALQDEEIKTLNEKAKVDKLTKGLYGGGMVSALALFGLSVFGYRQRIKKNKIAREKQEEIYKQEIEHKKKELTSQTLHLVQKNTFIKELMENLENIKKSPEKFKTEFRRIVMLLKKENASDKDWEVFKTYFAEVHNDFDQKLKTLAADISEKEIRLAAFLRMNLTTKEIAATLNVLPDSILKSKYRLKKKLNIDKETDLTSFLNTL
ncbi:tetratricopeptide repeat protein [Croceitalea marina]|uniref:Tetratricopeptide repeat protein n=1 Tax=Croceitalea marina TaxID=1775166 RepID=A0ABW5MQX1_9FLAO